VIYSPEGIKVTLFIPEEKSETTLKCEDGTLTLLDYSFSFEIENQEAWMNLVDRIAGEGNYD
jgi:hypothetical protein